MQWPCSQDLATNSKYAKCLVGQTVSIMASGQPIFHLCFWPLSFGRKGEVLELAGHNFSTKTSIHNSEIHKNIKTDIQFTWLELELNSPPKKGCVSMRRRERRTVRKTKQCPLKWDPDKLMGWVEWVKMSEKRQRKGSEGECDLCQMGWLSSTTEADVCEESYFFFNYLSQGFST